MSDKKKKKTGSEKPPKEAEKQVDGRTVTVMTEPYYENGVLKYKKTIIK